MPVTDKMVTQTEIKRNQAIVVRFIYDLVAKII